MLTRFVSSIPPGRSADPKSPENGRRKPFDPRVHFGLGKSPRADSVEIRWPDGVTEKLENVKANQFVKLVHEARTNGVKP